MGNNVTVLYNEIDDYAAYWLRNLVDAGHIAHGVVDQRSIEDLDPDELRRYTQCHFFAGIGVWSRALRMAGWSDDRRVWTGSCPCQPFSAAGKGAGFADERHLWPTFHWLIEQCRPPVVFGEQVASRDGLEWLDLVQADLEGSGYATGAADLCAAGLGAPHIRQRLYWVADANHQGSQGYRKSGNVHVSQIGTVEGRHGSSTGVAGGLADSEQHNRGCKTESADHVWQEADRPTDQHCGYSGAPSGMADTDSEQHNGTWAPGSGRGTECADGSTVGGMADAVRVGRDAGGDRDHRRDVGAQLDADGEDDFRPGPINGFWRDADWLGCRDGKWRPVESGTFPLAQGATGRVGRLRAYGNAIVPQVAQAFIEAYDAR